jgi:hypothetical protein
MCAGWNDDKQGAVMATTIEERLAALERKVELIRKIQLKVLDVVSTQGGVARSITEGTRELRDQLERIDDEGVADA